MALAYGMKIGCCDSEYATKLMEGIVAATLDEINVIRTNAALSSISLASFEDAIKTRVDAL